MTAPGQYKCDVCKDQGVLGRDPNGDILYCEECLKGAELAMDYWRSKTLLYANQVMLWALHAPPDGSGFPKEAQTAKDEAIQEFSRLQDLWDALLFAEQEYELEHPFFEDTP